MSENVNLRFLALSFSFSSKVSENSFLKNGILEFYFEALIDSILTYSSKDN